MNKLLAINRSFLFSTVRLTLLSRSQQFNYQGFPYSTCANGALPLVDQIPYKDSFNIASTVAHPFCVKIDVKYNCVNPLLPTGSNKTEQVHIEVDPCLPTDCANGESSSQPTDCVTKEHLSFPGYAVIVNNENRLIKILESTVPLENLMAKRKYPLSPSQLYIKEHFNKERYGHVSSTDVLQALIRQFSELSPEAKKEYEEAAAWLKNYRQEIKRSLSHVLKEHGVTYLNVPKNRVARLYTEQIWERWKTMTCRQKEPYYRRSEKLVQDYIDAVSSLSARQLSALKILSSQAKMARIKRRILEELPSRERIRELIEMLYGAPKPPLHPMFWLADGSISKRNLAVVWQNFKTGNSNDPLYTAEAHNERVQRYRADYKSWEENMVKSGYQAEVQLYRFTESRLWKKKVRQWAMRILQKCRVDVLNKHAIDHKRPLPVDFDDARGCCFVDTSAGSKLISSRKARAYLSELKPELDAWEAEMRKAGKQRIVQLFNVPASSYDWPKLAKELNVYNPFTISRTPGDLASQRKAIWRLMSKDLFLAAQREFPSQQRNNHGERALNCSLKRESHKCKNQPLSPFRKLLNYQLRLRKKRKDEAVKRSVTIWRTLAPVKKQKLMAEHQETVERWRVWKSEQAEKAQLQEKLAAVVKQREQRQREKLLQNGEKLTTKTRSTTSEFKRITSPKNIEEFLRKLKSMQYENCWSDYRMPPDPPLQRFIHVIKTHEYFARVVDEQKKMEFATRIWEVIAPEEKEELEQKYVADLEAWNSRRKRCFKRS